MRREATATGTGNEQDQPEIGATTASPMLGPLLMDASSSATRKTAAHITWRLLTAMSCRREKATIRRPTAAA